MVENRLRQEITQVCHLMYQKGFIAASDGNVSARLSPGKLLITPSGLHKGLLEPEQILVVDERNGRPLNQTFANRHLRPTSELPMHLESYRLRPDIQAVVHAHPPITVALSIAGIPMSQCLLPEVIVFLGLIPTTAYATPSSEENVRAIREFIANHDGLVLQRHGSLTVGDSPLQGFMRLETIEQNARIAFMLAQLGVSNPLPAAEVRKLLEQRRKMGLMHAGEPQAFCETCGVCHTGDHPAAMPRTDQPRTPTADTIHTIVSQVVSQKLGPTLY